MESFTIFLIAVSLAMDAFAVSITNGICVSHFARKDALRQGIFFGGFQFLMPLLGWFLGTSVKGYIEAIDHWIAFILLAAIGGNMVWGSIKKETEKEDICKMQKPFTTGNLVIQAIATSIDALAVGISFALLNVNILLASALIGVVAFCFSYAGGILGKGLGNLFQKKTEFAGGILLIAIGAKILLEHLDFL